MNLSHALLEFFVGIISRATDYSPAAGKTIQNAVKPFQFGKQGNAGNRRA
jgi:hypothetical protein